jgi:hypothetical protein
MSSAGPAAMPAARASNAPKYPEGDKVDSLDGFLYEFDALANSNALGDRERLDCILWYVPLTEHRFWRSLDGYQAGDWNAFRAALEEIYPPTGTTWQHEKRQLLEFVRESCKSRIRNEKDLRDYHRQFYKLSNPIYSAQQLTDDERNKGFYYGFHPQDRDILAGLLAIAKPSHPINEPYMFDDLFNAARAHFASDRFHQPSRQPAYTREDQDMWYGFDSTRNANPPLDFDFATAKQPEYTTKTVQLQDQGIRQNKRRPRTRGNHQEVARAVYTRSRIRGNLLALPPVLPKHRQNVCRASSIAECLRIHVPNTR